MLANEALALGQVDAEGLVRRDTGMHPLHLAAEPLEDAVGCRGKIKAGKTMPRP